MAVEWTVEKPVKQGVYFIRLIDVPQFVQGMNFKMMRDGKLMNVRGCTVTPGTEGWDPMPDNCLTYTDFLESDRCEGYEFYGPVEAAMKGIWGHKYKVVNGKE